MPWIDVVFADDRFSLEFLSDVIAQVLDTYDACYLLLPAAPVNAKQAASASGQVRALGLHF